MNIRHLRFSAFFFVATTFAAHASAADFLDACQAQVSAANAITVEVVPAVVDPTIRRVSAKVLSKAKTGAAHSSDGVVLGHTGTQWTVSHEASVTGLQHDSERVYCYKPQLRVKLALSPIQVSVGSEVKSGCAFDYVLEHEKEHVRLFLAGLPAAAEAIQAELNAKFGEMRVGTSVQDVARELLPTLKTELVDIIVRQVRAQEAAHLTFDHDDVHHMEQHGCYQALRSTAQQVSMR